MPAEYLLKRLALFVAVLWGAATFNFLLPRLADINPIEERFQQLASSGNVSSGITEAMIRSYERRFGLDRPIWEQYLRYIWNVARFDFGFSIAYFPTTVGSVMAQALPWTIVLLTVVTAINFVLGIAIGALISWPSVPKTVKVLFPPIMSFSAIPYYLIGIGLIYVFAFQLGWLPLGGGYSIGASARWSVDFVLDAARHSLLPAMSIVLASIGFNAIAMRGMMVTTQGEDYMLLAEAKGVKGWRLFTWYGIRNAMLPQVTGLALSLGHIVSGAVLVEVVFSYPGVGAILLQAIRGFDYTLLYGLVYLVILSIAIATLILDLIYPRIDPRITYMDRG